MTEEQEDAMFINDLMDAFVNCKKDVKVLNKLAGQVIKKHHSAATRYVVHTAGDMLKDSIIKLKEMMQHLKVERL